MLYRLSFFFDVGGIIVLWRYIPGFFAVTLGIYLGNIFFWLLMAILMRKANLRRRWEVVQDAYKGRFPDFYKREVEDMLRWEPKE